MVGKVVTRVWSINDGPAPFRDAGGRSVGKQCAFAISGWRAVIEVGDFPRDSRGTTPSRLPFECRRFRGFVDAGWHGPVAGLTAILSRIVLVEAMPRRET